jgi:L-malate glycosyltransferase
MDKCVNNLRPRVIIVLWSGNYGGVERSVLWFAQKADREKFDYYFLFLHQGGAIRDTISSMGYKTYVLDWKNGFSLIGRLRLIKIISKIKPHLIHAQEEAPLVRVFMKMATFAPIISTQHGFFPNRKREERALFYKLDDHFTDLVIANSNFTAQKHSEFFKRSRNKMKTIYLGINPDEFHKTNAAPYSATRDKEKLRIVFIGRLEEYKGALQLPLLARSLKDKGEDFNLDIVGDGTAKEMCKNLASELGVLDNIRFLGWQSNIAEILHNSNILVSLSLCDESFGLVPLEALAAGVPVFAYASGAIVETIGKAPYSWVVPKSDYEQMAVLIKEYRTQNYKCDKFAGYKFVKEQFDISRTVGEIENIYEEFSSKY